MTNPSCNNPKQPLLAGDPGGAVPGHDDEDRACSIPLPPSPIKSTSALSSPAAPIPASVRTTSSPTTSHAHTAAPRGRSRPRTAQPRSDPPLLGRGSSAATAATVHFSVNTPEPPALFRAEGSESRENRPGRSMRRRQQRPHSFSVSRSPPPVSASVLPSRPGIRRQLSLLSQSPSRATTEQPRSMLLPLALTRSLSVDRSQSVMPSARTVRVPPPSNNAPPGRPWPLTLSFDCDLDAPLEDLETVVVDGAAASNSIRQTITTHSGSPTLPFAATPPPPPPDAPIPLTRLQTDRTAIPDPPRSPTLTERQAMGVGRALNDKMHLFLSTQRTQYQSKLVTMQSPRFLLRALQLAGGIAALVCLYSATFVVNFTSTSIGISGINLASLTAVSSVVLSVTAIFILLLPTWVGVAPARERSVSPVEIVLDGIYAALWIAAAAIQAAYGTCPQLLFRSSSVTPEANLFAHLSETQRAQLSDLSCVPWNVSWAVGLAVGVLYLVTCTNGFRTWWKSPKASRHAFLLM
ncbi:hypothetical protein AMAG_04784 [Allomyces macrogynus ATCC 38327]|uniref:MARVEL domain-containing protein n=1 Tax=Allomyces macrogynus (strain ATCC 38327) TaxID=578462 RepID=A0A0L0S680_ALLM3|nr:hypothetical protein AMAG_04784 [Allomyces macrogynus ATCC 38327]|eukprot:KNE57950.1 hypothetical protein AMAG_04784 [Allomyces macrogynus ATCC 38327]